ncbi:MAG: lipopolysaccharide biosynthesis protein [Rhodanobacter sp.]|nr:MAG: lipopolysaccharide biosynthesis protein [Rhodanobacter sp.]TAL94002.1 MAG: lipopolysaccharide biosynthesis protein [Rhodanobacter sp.]TAM40887.1 MAG: lipopolysaccharide biosynthesis protein [Rhodanobacter sp.]TAN25713.1 MAG: lipopolysaccharide biosynthesis protein [Rhodanobacter sp.]
MQKSPDPHSRSPSIRRSLGLSFAKQYTNLLFAVPTVIILSRLLTPAQVGVYSVGAATITLAQMLRDFGVSQYLVQAHDLDDVVVRSAFTVNLCIAWTLAIVMFVVSPWIGDFYDQPGLTLVLRVLSINFLLLPFGSTVNALLTRSMQFGILYRINLGELCLRTGTTMALAVFGFGYMSPAWGSVAGVGANVLGCWVWGRAYRIRGLSLAHWRAVTRFGLQQTIGDIMNRVGFYAPDFVIGRILTFADVGLYSRGYGLLNMFQNNVMGAIGAVAFPAFAHRHHNAKGVDKLYLKSLTFITGISLPFAVFSALMAFPIIRIMFGTQWDMAVPILRLLAIAAGTGMLIPQFGQFFTAIGKVKVTTGVSTITQIVRIAVLVPATMYGLEAAAASQILVAGFSIALKYAALRKYTAITARDIVCALVSSLGVTGAAIVLPLTFYALMPPSAGHLWAPFVLASLGAAVGWLIGVRVFRHPLWAEMSNVMGRVTQWRRSIRNDRS